MFKIFQMEMHKIIMVLINYSIIHFRIIIIIIQFLITKQIIIGIITKIIKIKIIMLYLIGIGLGDERDITVRGLEYVKKCSKIYLEGYTSILMVNKEKLEEFYGKEIIVADREKVESDADEIIDSSETQDVALLVVGDPMAATTHSDIVVRTKKRGIPVRIVPNASIMNAVGATGLQLYRFGHTVSLVFFEGSWRPDSFYDKIAQNRKLGLHTLCLLDIKVKEQSLENLAKGRKIYEPPRYMSVNTAIEQLLEIEEKRQEKVYTPDTMCVGVARMGTDTEQMIAGTMQQLRSVDFGPPLHSLVICGDLHELETEYLDFIQVDPKQ
eukprot:gb/GECH01008140.1/.p1 GENE.gb/GECH01008140.1/~~gb/GECH01008140.1/.p1  ORF type:complete len:325 (+),score=75.21 gb/GECH01008140.1/:1-975(+)